MTPSLLKIIARRRKEEAVELGLTDTFTDENGFDTSTMLPEMLRFYLNEYSFDMVPSMTKVKRMLQSGCWCQILKFMKGQGAPSSEFDRFCEDWQRCKGCVANDGCQDHDIYRTNSGKAHASHFPYKVKYNKIHLGDKCWIQ